MKNRPLKIFMVLWITLGCWVAATDAVPPGLDEISQIIRSGDLKKLQALVEKDPALLQFKDERGRTLLHGAAAAGRLEIARWLIDRGADVNARTVEMATPLMQAALAGKGDMARLLIARGADLDTRDGYQRTALVLVGRQTGDSDMAAILLGAGADINAVDRNGESALSLAAWRGFSALVDLLLDRGAKIPADPGQLRQAVSLAVARGLDGLFDRCLAAGADLSAADDVGGSLLHSAADGGSERIIKMLLANKLDPNARDRNGWTPLHRAAERGRLRAAALLIGRGARLNERTLAGETPLSLAIAEKNDGVAALLKRRGATAGAAAFPLLQGEYMGQRQPGDKPELFAPGIVSGRFGLHCPATFSPDGREAYWNVMVEPRTPGYSVGRLLCSRLQDGRWTYPEIAAFTGEGRDADVPFFAPDGKRLYFMSRRPIPSAGEASGEHIWYMERQGDGWTEARPVDETVNRLPHHWQFSVDNDYNLYFSTTIDGGQGRNDIYRSNYVNGRYAEPQNLGAPVNTPAREEMPFIAPDGSYLLFARDMDLYASFRRPDGSWSEPVTLGPEINSPSIDICPRITANGKFLFFLSQRGGESHTWWASADIIGELRRWASLPSLDALDDLAAAYFSQDRLDRAIAVFEYAKSRFPAGMAAIIRRLASFYAMTQRFDKVMDNWELGQSQGLFFRAGGKMFEPLFGSERYQKFIAANEKLLAQARKNARAEYDVVLPAAYDAAKKYPLFIVLHGNNINTAAMKPRWKLGKLAGSVILAFLQSSQVSASESFIWDDQATGRRDIAEFFAWLQGKYKIDKKRVLVGGFSGGAAMAMDAALRGIVPARGFVALCPGGVLPGRSDLELFKRAARRGLAGQIIAGEKDDPQEAQALAGLFTEAGLRVGVTVVPGLGHEFPADLAGRLDSAVALILKK